jgi:hypothetical protein
LAREVDADDFGVTFEGVKAVVVNLTVKRCERIKGHF